MKKLIALLFATLLVFTLAVPAFAATSTDVIDALGAEFEVDGEMRSISDVYVKMVEDFFARNPQSSADYDKALAFIKEGKEAWAATGKLAFMDMSVAEQQELINMAKDAAKVYDAKLSANPNNRDVALTDNDGRSFKVAEGKYVFKQTGADYTALFAVISLIVAAMGVSFVIVKKAKLAADR